MSLILAAAFVVAGCDLLGLGNTVCAGIERIGIDLRMYDADTGGHIVANDVRVIVRDGAFADTVIVDVGERVVAVGLVRSRAGIYEVSITAEGYAPWHRDGIRVRRVGDCNIETTTIFARLQPE